MENLKSVAVVTFGILLAIYGYEALVWYSYELNRLYHFVAPLIDVSSLGAISLLLFICIEIFESKHNVLTYVIKATVMFILWIMFMKLGVLKGIGLSSQNGILASGALSLVLGSIPIVVFPMSMRTTYKNTVSDLTRNAPKIDQEENTCQN